MTVTILASIFLALILFLAIIGLKMAAKQPYAMDTAQTEKCSICRLPFDKTSLIERQIGDYKILYFCSSCIKSLHNESISRN